MGGNGSRDMYADGSHFLFQNAATGECPNTRTFGDALREDTEVFAGMNDRFFDLPHEVDGAEMRTMLAGKIATKIEDGIADKLARAVIGDVSAAIDLVDFNSLSRE